MDLIELHILHSFPVSCLNRDDLGAPKSAVFGGVPRARVSSQCWKRVIREMASDLQGDLFAGKRTRFVIAQFKEAFIAAGKTPEEASVLAELAADATGKVDSLEKGNVKTLLYFSPQELQTIVDSLLDLDSDNLASAAADPTASKKDSEKARKDLAALAKKASKGMGAKVKDAADIAIFGRMVADDHSLTIDGAGLFSHAISTHRAENQVDFFSAVDDSKPTGDDAGAGHIGTIEFNSACYYRCIVLNLDLLKNDYLDHFSEEELHAVLDAFIRASVLAVPKARKNSMLSFNPPSYVLGLRRKGQPLSLANAFEKPVTNKGEGYIQPSAKALENHLEEVEALYGMTSDVKVSLKDEGIEGFISKLVG